MPGFPTPQGPPAPGAPPRALHHSRPGGESTTITWDGRLVHYRYTDAAGTRTDRIQPLLPPVTEPCINASETE